MSDILQRLRECHSVYVKTRVNPIHDTVEIFSDAANEIERLRLELERYRIAERQKYQGMETLGTMDGFHNGPSK